MFKIHHQVNSRTSSDVPNQLLVCSIVVHDTLYLDGTIPASQFSSTATINRKWRKHLQCAIYANLTLQCVWLMRSRDQHWYIQQQFKTRTH